MKAARLQWLAVVWALLMAAPIRAQTAPSPGSQPADSSPAANSPATSPPETIRFRRYFIPTEQKAELTRGYVPVKRDEFEQWLSESQRTRGLAPPRTHISRAEYIARFEDGTLRDAFALIDFQNNDGQPVSTILHPLNIALGSAVWLKEERVPAALGTGRDGQQRVLVPASGRMLVPWSMRGQDGEDGGTEFHLQLATSPLNRLIIALPIGQTPVANGTVVSPWSGDANQWRDYPEAGPFLQSIRRGYALWSIEFAGGGNVTLAIAGSASGSSDRALVTAQQNGRYTLVPARLELQSEITINVHRHAISSLRLAADPGLQLTEARLGEQRLEWIIEADRDGAGEFYRLQLPQPILGANFVLNITSYADLVSGESWTLPRIRLADALWQEERVSVSMLETLVLNQLAAHDCIQTRRSDLTGSGELYEFQCYTPDYAVQLLLEPREPQLAAEAGVLVRIDRETVTARWITDIKSAWGEQFRLRARVNRPWIVTHVELVPASALDPAAGSWRFENGILDIPLREPITPTRPMRVIVEARRRTPPERIGLSGEQLQFFKLLDMPPQPAVYRLQAATQHQIRLLNDLRVERIDPQSLSADDLSRLGGATDDFLLRGESLRSATAMLVEEAPGYTAETHVDVNVQANAVTESYRVRCTAESLPIQQIQVHLSQKRAAPLEWRLGDSTDLLAARLITNDERLPLEEGERWQIDLPTQRNTTFELRAQRTIATQEPLVVALASVPEATAESGQLTVRSYQPILWENGGLEALPLPLAADATQGTDLRGTFRYQPSQMDRFAVQLAKQPASARAWVWLARYTTRVFTDGQGVHEAVFRLQNTGQEQIEIEVPDRITVLGVDVDGRAIAAGAIVKSKLTVPLPVERRYPTIRLRYITSTRRLSWGGHIAVPLPHPLLPVLQSEWFALFPSDYQVWSSALPHTSSQSAATSWKQRLFGPLIGPAASRHELRFAVSEEHRMESFLRRLGEIGASPQATWRDIGRIDTSAADPEEGTRVWVDELALAARGFSPQTPLRQQVPNHYKNDRNTDDYLQQAIALMHQADLALIVHQQSVLISTRQGIRSWADCLVAEGPAGVYRVRPDSWLDKHLFHDDAGAATGFVPIAMWRTAGEQIYPWQPDPPFAASDNADAGWSAARVELDGASLPNSVSLSLIRITSVQQWAWSAYLAAVACGCWWCRARKSRLLLLIGLSAALALLLPVPLAPMGTNVFLGVLTAVLVLTTVPPMRSLQVPAMSGQVAIGSTAIGALLLLAWLAGAQETQPPAVQEQPAAAKRLDELRVLIPTDDSEQPTGEYWYVSRSLHEMLVERYEAMVNAGGFLLRSAVYTLPHNDARIPEIAVRLQIETFATNQIVELPLNKQEVQLIDARLNDEPANIRFNADGTAVLLVIPRQGLADVTLSLGARRVRDGEIDFAIPSVANALLNLPAAEPLEVPTAIGAAESAGDRQLISLGPARRILIRAATPARRNPGVRVAERLWLRIRPNSVVVDAQWTFEVAQGRLETVTVLADPRLRLRPLADGQPVDGEPRIEQSDYQRIEFPLQASVGSRFTLQASFFVRDSSGVGQQRLPRLEIMNAQYDQRLFAVSCAANLQLAEVEVTDAAEISAEQFVESWPSASEPPLAAYEMYRDAPPSDTRWLGISRFQAAVTTADQQLALRAGIHEINLDYSAALTTSGGPVFRRRLFIPKNFQPTNVSVISGEHSTKVRFAIAGQHELTVFLPEPGGTSQRLSVQGVLPVSGDEALPFPFLHLLDVDQGTLRIDVYRLSDVAQVELANLDGWTPQDQVPPPAVQIRDPLRFIGEWSVASQQISASRASLRLIANRITSEAYLATQLLREGNGWVADAEYHLQVQQGVVDVVRFEVPNEWEEPFELDPQLPFELRPVPGTTRRQLLIWPEKEIDHSHPFAVRVRGRLAGSGDRIRRAPDILPLDVDVWQRYLIVPTRLETQQIVWSTSGLVARRLPSMFQLAQQARDGTETYQILGSQFHAAIQRIERVAGLPQIRLADVNVNWSGGRRYSGVVAFDIEPAGLTECVLLAPAPLQIQAIALDGQATPVEKSGSGEYRVHLGPPQLPQRLEAIFTGEGEWSAGVAAAPLQAPWIKNLSVARTLWSVTSPGAIGEGVQSTEERMSAIQTEFVRADSIANIIDAASELANESGTVQAQEWLGRWTARLADARSRVYQWRAASRQRRVPALDQQLQSLDEVWQQHSAQLPEDDDDDAPLFDDAGLAPADLSRPWRAVSERGTLVIYNNLPGSAAQLRLTIPQEHADVAGRAALAAILFALACVATVVARRWWFLEFLGQYPQAMVALGGVLWIAFFAPSWIGWLLLVVAVVAAIRSPFPTARARQS